ncbi:hypothetical protein [Thermococcus alcaliphilus]|uniref:hypothetical protein n=1 Tax=Thermococcus alcaliphilus TaxID=139207 RepID=UPI002090C092|nr:hypothetical protein [Thermococcus alcaliphilus]MCO6040532.1 hypothetical protein [Thermococcus alcaliphilus]
MWRKALALGLVLMALGVVVGGAVEESKAGAVYGLYRWHKTGDPKQFISGVTGGILGNVAFVGGSVQAGSVKVAMRGIYHVALKVGARGLARLCPYVGAALVL